MNYFAVARAFLWKDFIEESSYRLQFALSLIGVVASLGFTYFVAGFVGPGVEDKLSAYGGDFFSFVVMGMGVQQFQAAALIQLSSKVREAQVLGTLEALIGTRASLSSIILSMPLFAFAQTSLRVFAFLGFGALFFDLPIIVTRIPVALVMLGLTVLAFGCLGLFVAALTLIFKRANAVTTAILGFSMFLGGVYFPVSEFPEWLQVAAQFFPITHSLEGLRAALLTEGNYDTLLRSGLALCAFVVLLLPTGLAFFRYALGRAMRDGTLTQY